MKEGLAKEPPACMAPLRSLWRGIREDSRLTVINRKEGVSWACRAPARPARLRDGNSPQGEGEPRRVCEQCRKGIRAACGKLTWGTAEGRPVDQRGGKSQDRSGENRLRSSDKSTTVRTFVPFHGKAPSFSGPAPAESQARACARAAGNPRLRCSAREGA